MGIMLCECGQHGVFAVTVPVIILGRFRGFFPLFIPFTTDTEH